MAARAPVAQWIERGRPKAGVGGSNPSGGATPTPHSAASAARRQRMPEQRAIWQVDRRQRRPYDTPGEYREDIRRAKHRHGSASGTMDHHDHHGHDHDERTERPGEAAGTNAVEQAPHHM